MTENPKRHEITAEQRAFAANALHSLPFSKLIGMRLVDLRPDEAMAFAVRTRLTVSETAATVDLTVHYLRPHINGKFTCTAKVVRAGKRIFTVAADVVNEDGQHIATAVSTYTRV
jgi:uncharacterized protein (TIGR00369 family)